MKTEMKIKTKPKSKPMLRAINYDYQQNSITIIDQTKLPSKIETKVLLTLDDVWNAISRLEVRGAPAIGIVAAYGFVMYSRQLNTDDWLFFVAQLKAANDYFRTARPTALNLFSALDSMMDVLRNHQDSSVEELKQKLFAEAERQQKENEDICRAIGEAGETLIGNNDIIMTYCNAGALATSSPYGTALAPIYMASEKGKEVQVVACETRPVLQGARLTALELIASQIPVTVICDNMAASYMREYQPSAVFVGADCVAANGDVANKIGTYGLALLAKQHKIPFYVCAPSTTINPELSSGEEMVIEHRDSKEVSRLWFSKPMIPKEAEIWNPAFDVTPAELIDGIITEEGIIFPPFAFTENNK